MDLSEQSLRLVQLEVERFLGELNAWLSGQSEAFEQVLYREHIAPRFARGFVFVRDGEQLDYRVVVERLRSLGGTLPGANIRLLDLELRQAGQSTCVALCGMEHAPGRGCLVTLVLTETPGGLKAVHAHASEFSDVESVVPERLGRHRIDPEVVGLLPRDVCTEKVCLPLSRSGAMLRVALAEPDETTIEDLAFLTGFRIEAILEDKEEILLAVDRHYPRAER